MEGFNVSCALRSRWAATVLDLFLFLGGCSSNCKGSDIGWVALFLSALDFFSLTVTWGVGFCPLSVLSDASESDVTSGWVENVGTTGGSENSHLSYLSPMNSPYCKHVTDVNPSFVFLKKTVPG